jgi:hypothetical protein
MLIARIDRIEQSTVLTNNTTLYTTNTATTITQDVVGPSSGGNKLYGGVDWCVQVDGIYVPPDRFSTDHADVICPALTTYGASLLSGPVLVRGDFLIEISPGKYANMTKFVLDFQKLSAEFCPGECVHDGLRNPLTCACMCSEYYTGDYCEIPTCVPHGEYNTVTGACVCDDTPYLDDQCRQALNVELSTVTSDCGESCTGTCVLDPTPTCICGLAGEFGSNCQFRCATERVDNSRCEARSSWGRDGCYKMPGSAGWSCVCGGGYTWVSEHIVEIAEMRCETQQCVDVFWAENYRCCSPGANCRKTTCGPTETGCCVTYSHTAVGCIAAGCSFCNVSGATTCTATSVVAGNDNVCTSIPNAAEGDWVTWQYTCADQYGLDVCDRATRATYLDVYRTQCESNANTSCLQAARVIINAMPWSRLDTGTTYQANVLYQASLFVPKTFPIVATLPATVDAPKLCVLDHEYLTARASISMLVTSDGINGGDIACLSRFYVIPTNDSTYYTFFLSTTGAFRYCLARQQTTVAQKRARMIDDYGTDTLNARVLVWRQLYDVETGTYRDYTQYCRTTPLGLTSFNANIELQQPVLWNTYNKHTSLQLIAVEARDYSIGVATTPAYEDVPFMPTTCNANCTTLGTCSAIDTACLKRLSTTVSWSECCFCLWKHTNVVVHCYA